MLLTHNIFAAMDDFVYDDYKPAVISVVIILNVVMNCLVIVVIIRSPALRQDRTTLFVCSLCVSDLASGCTAMPISAALCSSATPTVRLSTRYLPEIQMFCYWWFGFNSMYSLSWVALSKMFTIWKPLRYEKLLTRRRCHGIKVFNWVIDSSVPRWQRPSSRSMLPGIHLSAGFESRRTANKRRS